MKSPVPQAHDLVLSFQTTWVAIAAVVLELCALYWYVSAARRSGQRGRPWPWAKTASFVAALLVAGYTAAGGLAFYGRSNFTMNVVRCLLLFNVVPPLLAMSSPLTLALRASSRSLAGSILAVLRSPTARSLAHPALGVVVPQAVLYVYLLTPLYSLSERQPAVGAVVHLLVVGVGCLYWWPIVGRDVTPRPLGYPSRFAMVFASVPLTITLGVAISNLSRPLYAAGNTLADTHTGGDIYWELAQVFVVAVLALLLVSYASEEERRALKADAQSGLLAAEGFPPDAGAR